ncbi:MAG: helix-turn-helix domain-containing protein [Clostridia bacterium]|nr:helix-turn-helix domain-containing protein [Clostridia bacterium]
MDDLAKRLIYFREIKGYTTNKLADKAGISQSFVRDIELGKKKPSVAILSHLCDALDITLCQFFDDGIKKSLVSDDLLKQIFRLTPEQREKLADFLKLI